MTYPNIFRRFAVLTVIFLAVCAAHAQSEHITLDGRGTGRIFDGLGAVSAGASSRLLIDYPEPQRTQILDYLFKPGYGASLQRLKVEIGGDVNSTDGAEASHRREPGRSDIDRGYELWLMNEAYRRNPQIILEVLVWGAPGWVGKDTLYTRAMADYVADFIQQAERKYGFHISYAGVWNEKRHDRPYLGFLAEALVRAGLKTQIVCCDEVTADHPWSIGAEMRSDALLLQQVAAIGVHYPVMDGPVLPDAAARSVGKPLWSSEDQPNSGSGPYLSRDWQIGGRILAHLYNRNYVDGAMTATEIWSPVTSYYDILPAPHSGLMYANTPWSGHYKVQGAIWATAHTTQFAKPGWQYLDGACSNLSGGGSYVSLRAPNGKDWSVVLETIGAKAAQNLTIHLAGGLDAGTVHLWETSDTHTLEHVADLHPQSNSLRFTFEPNALYTLTTTTGQGKGTVEAPLDAAFPFPYRDDFEQARMSHLPRYLSDQNGAFERSACDGRPGYCLEQVISEKPIPWMLFPNPYTIAGDVNRADYLLASDFHFLSSPEVTLFGRIDAADGFVDPKAIYPSGYGLRIHAEGSWELIATNVKQAERVLASGKLAMNRAEWHHAEIGFAGSTITALIDATTLATVKDDAHSNGMFALGTGWGKAQFDNLALKPAVR